MPSTMIRQAPNVSIAYYRNAAANGPSSDKSPTVPVNPPVFTSCLGAPVFPIKQNQPTAATARCTAAIAKPRSPTRLGDPSTSLRRTKSLSDLTGQHDDDEKSLFWFRPKPSAPLTPPRPTTRTISAAAAPQKSERPGHRRSKTSPPAMVPGELSLPTLREDAPILKPDFMRDQFQLSSDLSFFDSTLYSDDEEEEEELILAGLTVLEGSDE
mmetsp:Transcript_3585/g.8981  ORF Transcript_3585/g.8981 Transcript_3585/m.8981 type:complete len:212 (-) Transcript_3585:3139-3774(-)